MECQKAASRSASSLGPCSHSLRKGAAKRWSPTSSSCVGGRSKGQHGPIHSDPQGLHLPALSCQMLVGAIHLAGDGPRAVLALKMAALPPPPPPPPQHPQPQHAQHPQPQHPPHPPPSLPQPQHPQTVHANSPPASSGLLEAIPRLHFLVWMLLVPSVHQATILRRQGKRGGWTGGLGAFNALKAFKALESSENRRLDACNGQRAVELRDDVHASGHNRFKFKPCEH